MAPATAVDAFCPGIRAQSSAAPAARSPAAACSQGLIRA